MTVGGERHISVQSGPLGAGSCEHPDANTVDTTETLGGRGSLALSHWVPRRRWTQEVAPVPVVNIVTADGFPGIAMC